MVHVPSRPAWVPHYFCHVCGQVHCIENGRILPCGQPYKHVAQTWRPLVECAFPPGAITPGPNARGLL